MSLLAVGPVLLAQQPANSPKGMPEPRNTGNVAEDEKAYLAEKTRWIQENPEEYRKMGGDPNIVIAPKKVQPIEDESVALPDFQGIESYQLVSFVAVKKGAKGTSQAETLNGQAGTKSDWVDAKMKLQFGVAPAIRLYADGRFDYRAVMTKNGTAVEWFFEDKECNSCSKTIFLQELSNTGGKIIYEMEDEDEASEMAFRLTFNKINQ